jgi:CHAT domain-containing protein
VSGSWLAIAIAAALWAAVCAARAQDVPTGFEAKYQRDQATAGEYQGKGLYDKAAMLYEDIAAEAERAGMAQLAAQALLSASQMAMRQNQDDRALKWAEHASALARGTPLETVARMHEYSLELDGLIASANYPSALNLAGRLYGKLREVRQEEWRRNLESNLLSRIQKMRLLLADWATQFEPQRVAEIDPYVRKILDLLLSDDLTLTPDAAVDDPARLEARRPWREHVLDVCLKINQRATDLDHGEADKAIRDIMVAIDLDERGMIYQLQGQRDEAIAAMQAALEIFKQRGSGLDEIVTDEHLASLLDEKGDAGSQAQAFRYSRELIGIIESETFVQVAQTVDAFLHGYRVAYEQHSRRLWKQYLAYRTAGREIAQEALNEYLIHVDRFVFRPVRRDLAVYHDVGSTIGADPKRRSRLDRALKGVRDAQGQIDANARLQAAARDFVTALEDLKRHETRSIPVDPTITRYMRNVKEGMGADDGILMYFNDPERNGYVALLTSGDSRIFALAAGTGEKLRTLVPQVPKQLAGEEDRRILDELSALLLKPLPPLPERLTIALNDAILGVPFEALTLPDGRLLVDGHQVRYAFGLYPKVGARVPPAAVRRAFVIGAESFGAADENPLPESRAEVETLRALLGAAGAKVLPRKAMPDVARELVTNAAAYQVVHVSTHSQLEQLELTSVPILDSLLFPRGGIYAYELALASMRSSLVVLSACELYKRRDDRLYPVSGLTIASLARIAPQVISTLWQTEAKATSLFMARFYSRLVESGDAALALATTKRDFARGDDGLLDLATHLHLSYISSQDIANYRKPRYWAPFVLAVGVSQQPAAAR